MDIRGAAARLALMMICTMATAMPADARFWQCAPYARMISGVDIRGNASTWWGQAEGRYDRGTAPRPGAVLAFAASRRMPMGHVAMVSRVVGDREVLLTHANWSRRGAVETDVRAVDISSAGDWSLVKIWYGPLGDLGTSANPARGFIYAGKARGDTAMPALTIASAAHVPIVPRDRAAAFVLADLEQRGEALAAGQTPRGVKPSATPLMQ